MKILLVRLRLIGDVIFTTPLIRALRRHVPDAHIAYVVEPLSAPVVAGNPHLNEVIVVPRRRGMARMRDDVVMAARLRRARFDIAIDLHGGPRGAWFTWASRAPRRIGYTGLGRAWAYTDVVRRPADLTPRHSVLNQWDLLGPLGIGPCEPTQDSVQMAGDPEAASHVDARLRASGIGPSDTLVVMHVSAGNPFRRWPPESFATLVVELARRDQSRRFLLTSGPSDRSAATAIVALARHQLGVASSVVTHGEFGPTELRALASRAAVYIGGDSGPMHIAATTATPIVALFGPTLSERSMPWRDPRWFAHALEVQGLSCRPCHQRTCVPGDFRCLTRILPAEVAEATERALASGVRDDR